MATPRPSVPISWKLPSLTSSSVCRSTKHYFQAQESKKRFYPGKQVFPNLANNGILVPFSDSFHLIIQCNFKKKKKRNFTNTAQIVCLIFSIDFKIKAILGKD